MTTRPTKTLETFPNPNPERDYEIRFDCPEFTCLCPKTGQPDFAIIHVDYVPDALCVELKSWKLYLWSYRNEGAFHEAVTNQILDDLVAATRPRRMRVTVCSTFGAASRPRSWPRTRTPALFRPQPQPQPRERLR